MIDITTGTIPLVIRIKLTSELRPPRQLNIKIKPSIHNCFLGEDPERAKFVMRVMMAVLRN